MKDERGDAVTDGFPIVGVGASAGGLEALREMFGGFDGDTGMAFVVVQHLDPTHESLMAELIGRCTPMTVRQASGGEKIAANHIYVIPPGYGLALEDGVLELTEFKDPRGMRRPIDDFFESLAEDQGSRAACVILSGTGADGSRGLRAIKEFGGLAVAERPERAAYDGMPSAAISTGLIDIVSDPRDILGYLRSFFDGSALGSEDGSDSANVANGLAEVCDIISETIGHDFSLYKRSTLNRRVMRRMQVLGIVDSADYIARLRSDTLECEALFRDLLINVTKFFRDPKQFEGLNRLVIDPLVAKCRDAEEIRVWVPGCSSGEEAYSIAMMFAEACKRHGKRPYIQIFATDIDDKMLEIARAARYPLSSLTDIPSIYRDEYVVGGSDRFSVTPKIRDMVRFSVHNLVRDPPYSKIDLISCRNLLIYFEQALQRQVIPLFHFALKEGGRLFLGSSEGVGRFEDLFELQDQESRLHQRRSVTGRYSLRLNTGGHRKPRSPRLETSEQTEKATNSVEIAALKIVAQTYAPVSLLVDREGMLLDRWGAAGRYLDFPDRLERTVSVPALARPGLRELVGPLLRQVHETKRRAGVKDVTIQTDFGVLGARVVCEPVDDGVFLIIINETKALEPLDLDFDDIEADDTQLQFLEDELRTARYRLRTTVEELETANEELKSSNEEMMSMNEELQSTNEELTTVNDELKNKVDQLTVANSDLKNFFDNTQLSVLLVDSKLRLRNITDAAQQIFPVDATFTGKPLDDLPHNLADRRFVSMARRAALDGETVEESIKSTELDREFVLRAMPYRLIDGEIDGATLVLSDVTESVTLQRKLREEQQRLTLALEVAKIGVWEYDPTNDSTVLDATERELLGIAADDAGTEMEPILSRLADDDRSRVNKALRMAIDGDHHFNEVFRLPMPDGSIRWLHGMGRHINFFGNRKFIGVTFDISDQRQLLAQRELMIHEMSHRVKNLFSVVSAMVSIVGREANGVEDLVVNLRDRIGALGRSHALTLSQSETMRGAIEMADLVQTVIQPNLSSQRVRVTGDPVAIDGDQLTSLALILYEWATNATKYGALSDPEGSLTITWERKEEELVLIWREIGTKAGSEADGKPGFGTRLVEAAARQLSGTESAVATEEGFERRLTFAPIAPKG